MCTVSWVRTGSSYTLLFNRDERGTRARGAPPRLQDRRGVRWIAPNDPDGGGSWIGVNEYGLTLALLNRYDASGSRPDHAESRGLLVPELLHCSNIVRLDHDLNATSLDRYRPFSLVGVESGDVVQIYAWNGRHLTHATHPSDGLILTSSSVDQPEAERQRRSQFDRSLTDRGGFDRATLQALHRSHLPEVGPFSVCMHRSDAATQSLSAISVSTTEVTFAYTAGAPCVGTATPVVGLRRLPALARA